jgi:hypothetical protein
MQKLYKDCGWKIGNFERDKFEERREDWARERIDVEIRI